MTRSLRRLIYGVLIAVHALVLGAGFIAPYSPTDAAAHLAYAPPSPIHFVDADGQWHARPFVYGWTVAPAGSGKGYVEDTSRALPIRFFVTGAEHQLLPGVSGTVHLFGVDAPGRIALLGTDADGRDVFSRLLFAGRVSLGAGLLAALCSLIIGLAAGTLAGFYGGTVDRAVMRAADVITAVPWLYLLVALRAALPFDSNATTTLLLMGGGIGIVCWPRVGRQIREIVHAAQERGHVTAARGFGGSDGYLLRRHVAPQVAGVMLTQAALLVPVCVLAEVTLSFLGLGVAEPTPSWGNMLGAFRESPTLTYWWLFAPAAALAAVAMVYGAFVAAMRQRFRLTSAW